MGDVIIRTLIDLLTQFVPKNFAFKKQLNKF